MQGGGQEPIATDAVVHAVLRACARSELDARRVLASVMRGRPEQRSVAARRGAASTRFPSTQLLRAKLPKEGRWHTSPVPSRSPFCGDGAARGVWFVRVLQRRTRRPRRSRPLRPRRPPRSTPARPRAPRPRALPSARRRRGKGCRRAEPRLPRRRPRRGRSDARDHQGARRGRDLPAERQAARRKVRAGEPTRADRRATPRRRAHTRALGRRSAVHPRQSGRRAAALDKHRRDAQAATRPSPRAHRPSAPPPSMQASVEARAETGQGRG